MTRSSLTTFYGVKMIVDIVGGIVYLNGKPASANGGGGAFR